MQGLSRSLQRELNSFYQKVMASDFSIQQVTKGAFTQARAKLKHEAFIELNRLTLKSFYEQAPYLRWQGFRILAIDGTTLHLPQHASIKEAFGVTHFGPHADKPHSIARVSMLYDVLNLTTLDAQLDGYACSEAELARRHFPSVKPHSDLILFDRGYPSLSLMYELQQQGLHFCIRMREDWWLEVRKLLADGAKDRIVTFKLPAQERHLMEHYSATNDEIRCRLVAVELPDSGGIEVLCTSVLDAGRLPYECFVTLYHYRWNIEEGYKLYKCRIEWEVFSGKTEKAVRQDFSAKVFMMTLTAALAFPIEEKIKEESKKNEESKAGKESIRKHRHKVNRTNALAFVKDNCVTIFIKKLIRGALSALDKMLRVTTEIIRPNRTFPRKKYKKRPPSMNYKRL